MAICSKHGPHAGNEGECRACAREELSRQDFAQAEAIRAETERQQAAALFIRAVNEAAHQLLKVRAFRELGDADHDGFKPDNGALVERGDDWTLRTVAGAFAEVTGMDAGEVDALADLYPNKGGALLTDTPSILLNLHRARAYINRSPHEAPATSVSAALTWNEAYQLGYALIRHASVALHG